ncbi:hypothetical protein [Allokutzneria oryzae]|uniref:Uncharacterized protein n=1 Tax=Allokutzneria oryzae TaxID=1378989 RepID=A0ABV5ZS64_9PSEU
MPVTRRIITAAALIALSLTGAASTASATVAPMTPAGTAGIQIKYYYVLGAGPTESAAKYDALTKAKIKANHEDRNGWECGFGTNPSTSQSADGTYWNALATVSCTRVTKENLATSA